MIYGFNDSKEKVEVYAKNEVYSKNEVYTKEQSLPRASIKIVRASIENVAAVSTGRTTLSASVLNTVFGIEDITEWTIVGLSYELSSYSWTHGGDVYNGVFYPYVSMTDTKGLEFHVFNWAGSSQTINIRLTLVNSADIMG